MVTCSDYSSRFNWTFTCKRFFQEQKKKYDLYFLFVNLKMMAKLAKRLNESDINVILTQSASMANLTSALKTLRVYWLNSNHLREFVLFLGKKGSNCFRQFRYLNTCFILLWSLSNIWERYTWTLCLDINRKWLSFMEFIVR